MPRVSEEHQRDQCGWDRVRTAEEKMNAQKRQGPESMEPLLGSCEELGFGSE